MASLPATILNVVIERGADDGSVSAIGALRLATVYCDAGGVAVAGGTDTLGVALNTAIQNSARDGKTVTIRSACISKALVTTLLAAPNTKVTHAGFMSVVGAATANAVEITPKSDGYLTGSTNSTIASTATVAVTSPYAITCSYTVA